VAGGFTGAFLVVFFFGSTVVFFTAAAAAVTAESAAAFALANALAVRYNLINKLLAASNAPVETLSGGLVVRLEALGGTKHQEKVSIDLPYTKIQLY
jgi:hypothetical protein